jgi:HAD superfamily hydrolase (TIGR01509 family)
MGVSGKQAIVFDFDGTLVDASNAICHSFNQALEKCQLPRMDPQEIRAMIGRPLVGMFESVEGSAGVDADHFVREYRGAFFSHSLVLTRLMPGAEETLTHFSSRLKLGIATSRKSDGALHILKNFGLLDHFSAVVGIEHVSNSKPDPEPIHRTLEQLQVPAEQSVMVGDTTDDMTAGKRAGLTAVGVTTGTTSRAELIEGGADHVVTELSALVDLVDLSHLSP